MHSDELIREVEEELQRDRLLGYWRRYGTVVTVVAVLAVAGTAGWIGWQAWKQRARLAEASAFTTADQLTQGASPLEGAKALDQFATTAAPGYATVARLTAATVASAAGDQAIVRGSLQAVAEDANTDPMLRDLAALLAMAREIETGDPKALIQRLTPLTVAGAPWRHYALQLLASAQLRAGDRTAARDTLHTLVADGETPASLRRRASELEQALGGAGNGAS